VAGSEGSRGVRQRATLGDAIDVLEVVHVAAGGFEAAVRGRLHLAPARQVCVCVCVWIQTHMRLEGNSDKLDL